MHNALRFQKIFWILIFFLIFSVRGFAQELEPQTEQEKEQKIEGVAEQTDAELDYNDLLQDIEYYQKHKINLNKTSVEELHVLFFMTDIQISNLLEHIKKYGKLLSVYELQGIPSFDTAIISKMLPYVTVDAPSTGLSTGIKGIFQNGSSEVYVRWQRILEDQAGYAPISDSLLALKPNSRYLGSPDKLNARYRFKYGNKISWGITGEKDYGEEFFKGSQKNGFDFYSAHLFIRDISIIKALAIGDFHAQFGQGLTLWTGMGFGKSSDVAGVKKLAQGLRPYTSTDENRFLRGAGITLGKNGFELTGFYSQKKVDGNVLATDSLTSELNYISSLQETGLHSTPAEMADRHAVKEQIAGGHFAFRTRRLNIGISGVYTKYGANLQRKLVYYNQFEFNGNTNYNYGIDYSYIVRNFNIFGETSRSQSGGIATLNGLMVSLDKKVSLSVVHRYYQRNYQALYTSAFGDGSRSSNENGLYIGLAIAFNKKWALNAYVDNVNFPWLKYKVNNPSLGQDYLVDIINTPNKKLQLYGRFRYEHKGINNTSLDNIINYAEYYTKQSYRFNLSYAVSPSFTLKSRVEYLRYKQDSKDAKNGFLIYQDVKYKANNSPVSVTLRYMLFDTDAYEARMYTYENDVMYSSSVPGLYYKGSRWYLLASYHVNRYIVLYARFAQTIYTNKNVIGSGMTAIAGNTKSEAKAEVIFKF
ncbi:MAG: hypothetical protein WCM76_10035 [Bacteroidota bacterium]